MAKEKGVENIAISPVVVASSLGMVALGGKASTASQVKTVLRADKLKDEHLHAGLSELLTEVKLGTRPPPHQMKFVLSHLLTEGGRGEGCSNITHNALLICD